MSQGRLALKIKPSFSICPLFYDALSQEFTPTTDTRQHTIGRLMVATVMKGDFEFIEDKTSGLSLPRTDGAVYTYNPSWAPNVDSTAYADYTTERSVLICGINFYNSSRERKLAFSTRTIIPIESLATDRHVVHELLIDDGESGAIFELELGDKLEDAREAVTIAAEDFF